MEQTLSDISTLQPWTQINSAWSIFTVSSYNSELSVVEWYLRAGNKEEYMLLSQSAVDNLVNILGWEIIS